MQAVENKNLHPGYPQALHNHTLSCLASSLSQSTWKKYNTAWNLLQVFCNQNGSTLNLPLDTEKIRAFTSWCSLSKKLKAETIQTYLSSLHSIETLLGFKTPPFISDAVVAGILRGTHNLQESHLQPKPPTHPITFDILKLIGHFLFLSERNDLIKETVWTVCLVCFFGSMRLGEVLSPSHQFFDATNTLIWGSVKFRKNCSMLIHIRLPKNRKPGGEFIDFFAFPNQTYCPVTALHELRKKQIEIGIFDLHRPVFSLDKNHFLSSKNFLDIIKETMLKIPTLKSFNLCSNSFRQAIPSIMACNPSLFSTHDLKFWGRWHSNAHQHYTKLKYDEKLAMTSSVYNTILFGADPHPIPRTS